MRHVSRLLIFPLFLVFILFLRLLFIKLESLVTKLHFPELKEVRRCSGLREAAVRRRDTDHCRETLILL